ncbi:MAG: hypothetical protein EOO12_02700 [Chitinophagaceae bacterium]|nr:MAG: hypothetical protein EOO12_02700 [Chitinophagaceae bacterium]
MDQHEFQKEVRSRSEAWKSRWEQGSARRRAGRVWTGLFLLAIGGLLFARQAGVLFPHWLFTWPVLLIAIGLWIGVRHRFRGFGWLIPIAIGGLNLMGTFEDIRWVRPYVGPAILVLLGLLFIFKPRRRRFREEGGAPFGAGGPAEAPAVTDDLTGTPDRSDRIDITAVFGGVKKNVLSKNFRGGDIVTFMGGAEVNLSQADFEQRITIDCTNVFGGTKLIIPPDWEVQSDIAAVFGGVDDKRPPSSNPTPGKVIFLDGTCLFGGVEIRSYY